MSAAKEGTKRSRWSATTNTSNGKESHDSNASVPDDVAMQAILVETQARQAEREKNPSHAQKRPRRTDTADATRSHDSKVRERNPRQDSYYGPSKSERQATATTDVDDKDPSGEKEKPNFGVSGALAKDLKAGNMYRGVLLKFQEPPEARAPNTLWRLYVYKGDELLETLHINRQSAYLCGRNADIADIPLLHPSCSSQHAVIQYRAIPDPSSGKVNTQPYIMDLESANGTWLNGVPIDAARYYQLKRGDVLKFGASTREYVLLAADTKKI